MLFLIVSDSHGRNQNLRELLGRMGKLDGLFHLGDVGRQEEEIRQMAGCPVWIVAGNNDFLSNLPKEELVSIGSHKIFMSHGHKYQVYNGTEWLKDAARLREADIVLYGHTHVPSLEREEDVVALNPGSISFPRQSNYRPTYALLEIDARGECHFTQCEL